MVNYASEAISPKYIHLEGKTNDWSSFGRFSDYNSPMIHLMIRNIFSNRCTLPLQTIWMQLKPIHESLTSAVSGCSFSEKILWSTANDAFHISCSCRGLSLINRGVVWVSCVDDHKRQRKKREKRGKKITHPVLLPKINFILDPSANNFMIFILFIISKDEGEKIV